VWTTAHNICLKSGSDAWSLALQLDCRCAVDHVNMSVVHAFGSFARIARLTQVCSRRDRGFALGLNARGIVCVATVRFGCELAKRYPRISVVPPQLWVAINRILATSFVLS
jgi:hypothetical protein